MTAIDPAGMGKYGSLKVLKKRTNEFAACFPIDDEELTFGRNPECGVRLYYPTVSMYHCKIIFSEGQAFLLVTGANGVQVDGTKIFPSSSDHPTAVLLEDGSIIEIQKKRFEFSYPPHNYSAQPIIDSPFTARRRSVRMSMIEAAQIFTPNPPRVLSPDHLPRSEAADFVSRIMETDAANSVVIENEKDVIVLEQVQEEEPRELDQPELFSAPTLNRSPSTPGRLAVPMYMSPQRPQKLASNPRRRSEPSLHKAVLLRSAQRALQQRQREEMEEMEVELTVSPTHFSEDEEDGASNERGREIEDVDVDTDEGEAPRLPQPPSPSQQVKRVFRKSLEAVRGIIPFNWSGSATANENGDEERLGNDEEPPQVPPESDSGSDHAEDEDEEDEELAEVEIVKQTVLPSKASIYGQFATPQKVQTTMAGIVSRSSMPIVAIPKSSARRVPVLDLSSVATVSPTFTPKRVPQRTTSAEVSLADQEEVLAQIIPVEPHRPTISEQEKLKIKEKRKSFNPEMFSQLPPLKGWTPKAAPSVTPPKHGSSIPENEDLDSMIANIQERASEMKRKSLVRKLIPRYSVSPIKVEQTTAATPSLATNYFKSAKEVLESQSAPLSTSPLKDFTAKEPSMPLAMRLPSPRKSPQRKLPELPTLPVFDINSIPGLVMTPQNRNTAPQTPIFKGIRNLFKAAEPEPKLTTPPVQATGEFIFKREEIADIADTSEIEDILSKPSADKETESYDDDEEEAEVEDEIAEEVPRNRKLASALPRRMSPQELVQTRRTRTTTTVEQSIIDQENSHEIQPTKTRAGRILRSAEATRDEVPLAKPKGQSKAGRRAIQNTVTLEVVDEPANDAPMIKPKKTSRSGGRSKSATKTETAEEDEVDELDCLSPAKEMKTRTLRSHNDTVGPQMHKGKLTSDTEVSEKTEETKSKLAKRTGKTAVRKTRSKVTSEVEGEDPENKENSPTPPTRASRVPAAKRVKKEVKDSPVTVEEVDVPRMTRTRARRMK